MVAPGCNKADRKRIKDLGVEYFDSTAKDFFEELDDVLCENIVKDIRKKKVSERTFQSYCSWHNIEPIIHLKIERECHQWFPCSQMGFQSIQR